MCSIPRCKNKDIALLYVIGGKTHEVCERCWHKYDSKERLQRALTGQRSKEERDERRDDVGC